MEYDDTILLGSRMLEKLHLYAGFSMHFSAGDIGSYIKNHQRVVVTTQEVDGDKSWVLVEATQDNIRNAWGHGYLIVGKHFYKIGPRFVKPSQRKAKSFRPLKKGEAQKIKIKSELAMQSFDRRLQGHPSNNESTIPWLIKARKKLKAEKALEEKINKGIIPKAKIIYTPMGNDRRRK